MKKKDVLIIGAGISGLVTAYELTKKGYTVAIIESNSIPGGRIRTATNPFAGGMNVELGARRVPSSHYLTLGYIKEFNLPISILETKSPMDYYSGKISGINNKLYMVDQKKFLFNTENKLKQYGLDFNHRENKHSFKESFEYYFNDLFTQLSNPRENGWPSKALKDYDNYTVANFLYEKGSSKSFIDLLGVGLGDLDVASILEFYRHYILIADANFWITVHGGLQQLPNSIAASLANKIHYGRQVIKINKSSTNITTTIKDHFGNEDNVISDSVICSISPTNILKISFDPVLREEKINFLKKIITLPAVIILLQVSAGIKKYLEQFSAVITDHPMEITYTSESLSSARGILDIYAKGRLARQIARLTPEKRIPFIINVLKAFFPDIEEYVEGSVIKIWHNDNQYVNGAYYIYPPNVMTSNEYHQNQHENNIFFIGDYLSPLPGFIEGAIMSALSVCNHFE